MGQVLNRKKTLLKIVLGLVVFIHKMLGFKKKHSYGAMGCKNTNSLGC